ncbi:mandelate racemase/muconate lactonizing enzyme family protein [Roseomonas hellenica]|uniref:Mandelate racemase/muconate lactonizing enzyme family protein n=1 Tax=Plastoroseomonas hellenica TaxID=2687306 RepID=A0ABS5F0A6_9PROT|nr:mandelate racemase/muconate lactonizing enzyme family protein [Plastoroseomonas hellenica]MBR0665984.1 mandelate racemase/muconate lactonizing enzyme family protein [Plastoroseomonas hellenica]
MTRIRRITAAVRRVAPRREADSYQGLESLTFVQCQVECEDGLTGTGVTGRFLAPQGAALLGGEFCEALRGSDARDIEAIGASLVARFNPRGMTGAFIAALSALDMTLWDLRGKALGQPVWRLIGGARSAVPAYATVGLPRFSEAELVTACTGALARGMAGVKMLVGAGGRSLAEDAARVRAVRAAIGPAAALMLDANCSMSVADARRLCGMIANCDITWFEEPVTGNDIEALAMLRRQVTIPIAAGQMVGSITWFRDALARGALDWVQPNAAFCGGISAMLRILALAEAHGVPVAGAGGWEMANLPVMAGHAHGGMLEIHGAHAALRDLLAEEAVPEAGLLHAPERPGLGFAFREAP